MNQSTVSHPASAAPADASALRRLERGVAVAIVMALTIGTAAAFSLSREIWGFDVTRPFTPAGLVGLSTLLVPLVTAQIFMLRWGVRWSDYGLDRRLPPGRVLVYAGIATAAIHIAFRYVLGPLAMAVATSRPDVSHLANVPGNLAGYVTALAVIWVTAAFMEEIVCRGFLLNEAATALGGGRVAHLAAVLLVGAMFGAAHAYQGLSGMIMTGGVGILAGGLYLAMERSLWPLILAHGAINSHQLHQVFTMG